MEIPRESAPYNAIKLNLPNPVYEIFGDPNSKFFWLYSILYLAIAALIFNRFLFSKHRSVARILKHLFPKRLYLSASSRVDIFVYLINLMILYPPIEYLRSRLHLRASFLPETASVDLAALFQEIFHIEKLNGGTLLAELLATFGLFLVIDFFYFFGHYLQHRVPILWEIHKAHHTATGLTPITTYRTHPLSFFFQSFIIGLGLLLYWGSVRTVVDPLPKVFSIYGVAIFTFTYNLVALFRHSHIWISYGKLDQLLLSPAMHQIHHSSKPEHIDRNIGLILILWDRLFGTAYIPTRVERFPMGLASHSKSEMRELQSVFETYASPFRALGDAFVGRFKRNQHFDNSFFSSRPILLKSARYKRLQPILPLVVFLGFSIKGFYSGTLTKEPFANLSSSHSKLRDRSGLSFKMMPLRNGGGIDFNLGHVDPGPHRAHIPHLSAIYGGVTAADFNNDGKVDLYFPQPSQNSPDKLYLNATLNHSIEFIDATSEFGIKTGRGSSISAVAFDYNRDGFLDLYVARIGCHQLWKNIGGKRFEDVSQETGVSNICAWSTSVGLADFNRDGWLDLYIGNYHDTPGIRDSSELDFTTKKVRANRNGGANVLLLNDKGRKLVDVSSKSGVADKGYSLAVGIADFNSDGLPDIFVANDYGSSRMYYNQGNATFRDVTPEVIGRLVSTSNMSAAVGDINGDHVSDIYQTNISDPGNKHGRNSLLVSRNSKFVSQARKMRVDQCGFAWGAQFVDLDLDGNLDLVATSGYWSAGHKPYWYKLLTLSTLPPIFRSDPQSHPTTFGTHLAAENRTCLFLRSPQYYVDVSEQAGLADIRLGKSVAFADFDNDGRPDLVVTQYNNKPAVFRNAGNKTEFGSIESTKWIGLKMRSHTTHVGLKAYVSYFVDGKSKEVQFREIFPTNGYLSQSDDRLIFVVDPTWQAAKFVLIWPSGKHQELTGLSPGKYHDVSEP